MLLFYLKVKSKYRFAITGYKKLLKIKTYFIQIIHTNNCNNISPNDILNYTNYIIIYNNLQT